MISGSLFDALYDPSVNLLPCEGEVNYYGPIFAPQVSADYFSRLNDELPWQFDRARVAGKVLTLNREVVFVADQNIDYTYSQVAHVAQPWTPALREIKTLVEAKSGARFNACLCNRYPDGDAGVSWHSDAEPALGRAPTIASVSFGATRKFVFKHKTDTSKPRVEVSLEHGSLLMMRGLSQACWLHSLPKTKTVHLPRINLTFRSMGR